MVYPRTMYYRCSKCKQACDTRLSKTAATETRLSLCCGALAVIVTAKE